MRFTKIEEEKYIEYKKEANISAEKFINDEIFKSLSRDNKKIDVIIPKLNETLNANNWDSFSKELVAGIKAAEGIVQKLKTLPIHFGVDKEMTDKFIHISETEVLNIIKQDRGVVKLKFQGLLPRRMKNGSSSENLDYLRSHYYMAFEKFMRDNPDFSKYRERVLLIYKHFFTKENEIMDDDNFDIKIITDFIAQYMLIDDNPVRCMKLFDYAMSDNKHSEIWIIPMTEIEKLQQTPFYNYQIICESEQNTKNLL